MGDPFFWRESMPPRRYDKQHEDAIAIVAHLRSKGLVIDDEADAAEKITLIGYARLRFYLESRRNKSLKGKPFFPQTTYQQVLRIYECDRLLREACFAAVGEFEIMLRSCMSEHVSRRFGGHPYFNESAFINEKSFVEALITVNRVYAKTKDPRAVYYRKTYSSPLFPPIWYMKEFFSFGEASSFLKNLNKNMVESTGRDFGVASYDHFINWVDALVALRNICAHHGRLFNHVFYKQVQYFLVRQGEWIPKRDLPNNRLISLLQVLDYMMNHRGVPVNIEAKVSGILSNYNEIKKGEVGYERFRPRVD